LCLLSQQVTHRDAATDDRQISGQTALR
jgi:hypothetical protein